MKRNVICKNCSCEFTTTKYKLAVGKGKYCSPECYFEYQKNLPCKICGAERLQGCIRRMCKDCYKDWEKAKNKKGRQKQFKNYAKDRICKICGVTFKSLNPSKLCSYECQGKQMKTARIGKKNPAYRNGYYTNKKIKAGKSTTKKHTNACARYRRNFLKNNDYAFCEICKVNSNGTPRFEVHHIYFASKYPKHPELHNFKNLIHICIQCHNDLHSSKIKDIFNKIEEDRGLIELFKKE